MNIFREYNRTTKKPEGREKKIFPGQLPIDHETRKQPDANHVWAEIVVADLPELGENQKHSPLDDTIDESGSIWVVTTNRYEAVDREPEVPATVSKYILETVLEETGLVADADLAIRNAIDRLPEDTPEAALNKKLAKRGWATESKIERSNGLVPLIGQLLNLTSEQVDQLFIEVGALGRRLSG